MNFLIFTAKLSISFRGCKNTCQYKSTLLHNESLDFIDFSTFDPKGYESTWESSNFIVMKIHFTTKTCSRKYPKFKKTKRDTFPQRSPKWPSQSSKHIGESILVERDHCVLQLLAPLSSGSSSKPPGYSSRSLPIFEGILDSTWYHQLLCLFGGWIWVKQPKG